MNIRVFYGFKIPVDIENWKKIKDFSEENSLSYFYHTDWFKSESGVVSYENGGDFLGIILSENNISEDNNSMIEIDQNRCNRSEDLMIKIYDFLDGLGVEILTPRLYVLTNCEPLN